MRTDIDAQKDRIIALLESGSPRAEICRELNCKYETLKSRLIKWEVSHLKNQQGKDRPRYLGRKRAENSLYNGCIIKSHVLKLRLWRDGLKPRECEECGWKKVSEDGRLPLELHHINGNKWDNRIENLQILCPNCHSLKPGNSGNKLKGHSYVSQPAEEAALEAV